MDFQPPQWGSARARTAPRTVGAPPGALNSIISSRIAISHVYLWHVPHQAPSARNLPPRAGGEHSLDLPPRSVGVPPGA